MKSKRKNLNSIRSSINSDLMKLFRDGKNPEGIIIGPSNVFSMCDEAKDAFLKSLNSALSSDDPITLDSISEVTRLFGEFLNKVPDDNSLEFVGSILDAMSSKKPLPIEKTAEVLGMLDNLIANMPDSQILKENDTVKALLDKLANKAGWTPPAKASDDTQSVTVAAHEGIDSIGEEDISRLDAIDEEEIEEAGPADNPEEAGGDEGEDGDDSEGDSEVVEVLDVVLEDDGKDGAGDDPESGDDEDLPELDELEDVEDDELEESEEEEHLDEEELEEVEELDDLEEESESGDEGDDSESDSDVVEVLDVMVEDEDGIEEVEVSDDEIEEEVEDDGVTVVEEPGEKAATADFEGKYDIDEDEFDLEDLPETERKRILAERFDRYLGAMERHFNQFLLIPGGAYTIGSKVPTPGGLPEQQIQVHDFFMGKYPVINALFEVFVERTGYTTTAEKKGFGVVYEGRFRKIKDEKTGRYQFAWNSTHSWKEVKGAYWYQPTGPGSTLHQKRNHPVVQVSLLDAMAFASWVGKRLPTEAEWEAAARTDKGYLFPWGADWKDGLCNTETSEIADTTSVDHYPDAVNNMGIADQLGNTLEWTSEKFDPPNGSQNHDDYHIAKGGSWVSEENIQLASRFRFPTDFTSNTLGFRCLAD
jgi:formylglycine-generating enzyme required for sulfatase activity